MSKYELPYKFGIQEYTLQYNFTGVSVVIDWRHFVINITKFEVIYDFSIS